MAEDRSRLAQLRNPLSTSPARGALALSRRSFMATDSSSNARWPTFSLLFFASQSAEYKTGKFDLFRESTIRADQLGFEAVWIPERHFHSFGGMFPNPSLAAVFLAEQTKQIRLRAGSVVLPLHHPVRVVEEWSAVDNLSRGRVGISVASGFHPADFIFAPGHYESRRETMWEKIATVRRLWRGEKLVMPDGMEREIAVETYPRPVQAELPLWVTCANAVDTFERAGAIGANVLTALIGLPVEALGERLERYRRAREDAGFESEG
ncbi:MAG TPA: hypothetical protein DCY13_10525, partial [Verrucomicrobiales bacterium]|nr:hypothetical protein [Verrucomicrobiales bacterium]